MMTINMLVEAAKLETEDMIIVMNPNRWGEPAIKVVVLDGNVSATILTEEEGEVAIEGSDYGNFEVAPEEYEAHVFTTDTELITSMVDAYPEDDPGYCHYMEYRLQD